MTPIIRYSIKTFWIIYKQDSINIVKEYIYHGKRKLNVPSLI